MSDICYAAFRRQRYWIAGSFAARRPCGLAGRKKSSSLCSGIFSVRALRKTAIQKAGAYKIGKTYPDGIIHLKRKTMKVARIEKTGKQAVTLFLITGICLLANKGIVPIGLIALLLLTGGLMDLLCSLLFLVVKIMAVLAVLGLLFH